jgi:GNAT superfamily N-acetyltransferase
MSLAAFLFAILSCHRTSSTPMDSILIRSVDSKRDLDRFIKFQWSIYNGNSVWVPPLLMDRRKILDKQRNPFYKHAEAEFLTAERNGTMVGRIAAIVNHNHNAEHRDKVGFFGFFESIDDVAVSTALFDRAGAFLKSRGMNVMRGPANPSVNDDWGLLIDGFQYPPTILMPYNPSYYATLIGKYGFNKTKDLYAYYLSQEQFYTDRMERVYNFMLERHSMTFRSLDMKRFDDEVHLVKSIYNKAWAKNWGAVPMSDEEIEALAADLKPIVKPELVVFVEMQNKTIGFALSIPDINIALRYNKKGRLLPGLARLLFHKKKISGVRVIVLGVLPEYQKSGAAAMLFYDLANRARRLGYTWGEASWVLEDNAPMVRAAEAMNATLQKKYRLYDVTI